MIPLVLHEDLAVATEMEMRVVLEIPRMSTMPPAFRAVIMAAVTITNHPSTDRAVLPMATLPLRRMVQRMMRE